MRCAIVIVNYNGADYLPACLQSLRESHYQPLQILVVDNASTDISVRVVREQFGDVGLLPLKENVGFAAGNNAGIAQVLAHSAHLDAVLLLNPDTVVLPTALGTLAESAVRYPEAVLGPVLLLFPPPHGSNMYGTRVSLWRGRIVDAWSEKASPQQPVVPVHVLSGAALWIPTAVLLEVGGLDPDYFLYYEDTDYALRLERHRVEMLVVPAARVLHRESQATGGKQSASAMYYYVRNRACFVRKFARHRPQRAFFTVYHSIDVMARILRAGMRGDTGMMEGLWQGWREGMRNLGGPRWRPQPRPGKAESRTALHRSVS